MVEENKILTDSIHTTTEMLLNSGYSEKAIRYYLEKKKYGRTG